MSKFSDDVFFYLNEGNKFFNDNDESFDKEDCKKNCKGKKCNCSTKTRLADWQYSVDDDVCPECGKKGKKCKCSDNTEEMNFPKKGKTPKDFGSTPEEKGMIDFIKSKKSKKACKTNAAVDTEAYDGHHFDKDPETNEEKPHGSMKGYEFNGNGVRDGRTPNLSKYKDYGEDRPEVDPETNETKTKGSMEGFKLKEEILRTKKYIN